MSIRWLFIPTLVFLVSSCAQTVVLPVDEALTHDEIVNRLKTLFEKEVVMASDLLFVRGVPEEKISDTRTRLRYGHTTPQPPPGLYTPAVSFDWTFIEINTSQRGSVRISVRTYRRGNFIDRRQYEAEEQIAARLSILQERANSALQRTPASGHR